MTDSVAAQGLPRPVLLAAGVLILVALIGVATVRFTGVGAVQVPDAAAVTVKEFLFEDRSDGSIAILDARNREQVASVAPESNGFLRGTMRGLARERKRQGVGPDVAFQLVGRADGRLTLIDPGTKRRVDLESFGPTNAEVFAKLMTGSSPSR
jgi:putative photosynthetic complex assembly protein